MNQNLTELVCILDESTSMGTLQAETIQGFNKLVEDQKNQPGEVRVTVVTFSTESRVAMNGLDIKDVVLDTKNYNPNGWTALLDAIGTTINMVGKRLDTTPEDEKPGKVLVVIVTDGEENSSKLFSLATIKEMITIQTDTYKWEFIFTGANLDSIEEGAKLGVKTANSMNYVASSVGTDELYSNISRSVSNYRATGNVDLNNN